MRRPGVLLSATRTLLYSMPKAASLPVIGERGHNTRTITSFHAVVLASIITVAIQLLFGSDEFDTTLFQHQVDVELTKSTAIRADMQTQKHDLVKFGVTQQLHAPVIDIVYTWVNGSDLTHQRALQYSLRTASQDIDQSSRGNAGSNRFANNDELRYSLRSVASNAPWVRRIWLVVSCETQIPSWLNISHPKISIIYHRQIFSRKRDLPTFNSQAIEHHLIDIPGLADNFIYMNDDFFILSRAMPEDFFHPVFGQRIYFEKEKQFTSRFEELSRKSTEEGIYSLWGSGRNRGVGRGGRQLLAINFDLMKQTKWRFDELFGEMPRAYVTHNPLVMNKAIMAELRLRLAKEFALSSSLPFRDLRNIHTFASYFWYLQLHTGSAYDSEYVFDTLLDVDDDLLLDDYELKILAMRLMPANRRPPSYDESIVSSPLRHILAVDGEGSGTASVFPSSKLVAELKKAIFECRTNASWAPEGVAVNYITIVDITNCPWLVAGLRWSWYFKYRHYVGELGLVFDEVDLNDRYSLSEQKELFDRIYFRKQRKKFFNWSDNIIERQENYQVATEFIHALFPNPSPFELAEKD